MRKFLLMLSSLLLIAGMAGAQDITGKWYGRADLGMTKLRIIFDIQQEGESYTAKMQSPDQSGNWVPVKAVVFENDTLRLQIPELMFAYMGRLDAEAQAIEGNFLQMGQSFKLNLSREEFVRYRPQEPKPKYPYVMEDVVFRNEEAGINLAGTLTLPDRKGVFPAVVLVTGSGPQDRDETIMGHKPFWVIADHLTRQGIAVLRYDERGVAESEGSYIDASIDDFTADALAAVEYLKNRKEIAPGKTGLIGHSEGGCVAFKLASEGKLDFIVSLAGAGVTGRELMTSQQEAIMRASGATDFVIENVVAINNRVKDFATGVTDQEELRRGLTEILAGTPFESSIDKGVVELSSPAMQNLLVYDPAVYYPDIRCPVLALNGEKDLQVLCDRNLEGIRKGLEHNPDVIVKSYPGLNHLFQTAKTGLPNEYEEIEETFNYQVMKDMAEWILMVTR